MKRKMKIEEVEYTYTPIPLHFSPFSTRLGVLAQQRPATMEDMEQNSAEILKLQTKILDATVMPTVREEHRLEVYNAVVDLTNEIIAKARSFRADSKPNQPPGGSDVPYPGKETKRDSAP